MKHASWFGGFVLGCICLATVAAPSAAGQAAAEADAKEERGELDPRTVRELERAAGKDRRGGMGTRGRVAQVVVYGGTAGSRHTAAALLAEEWGLSLYRVDLDRVVSRYIGETEKNLARLFEGAGERDAVFFFDEADALFGKRTEVRDAHDRYANLEVSYLVAQARAAGVPLVLGVRRARASLRDGEDGWRVVRLQERAGDAGRTRDAARDDPR